MLAVLPEAAQRYLEGLMATGTVEGGYGDTLYKLHRASVKADLRTAKILQHLEIEDVSDEEIDNVLDEE